MKIIRCITEDNRVTWATGWDKGTARAITGDVFSQGLQTGEAIKVRKILPPVDPRAIICIGLNYRRHARETGISLPVHPPVFMKNPGAAAAHKDNIVIPGCCSKSPEVDYEAELGVIIKTPAKNVSQANALDHVLAYTIANDVSARKWQKHGGAGQWVKGKSFDTFCPFGPVMVTPDEIKDPQDLEIECRLNGEIMQKSNTRDMIFSVAGIIAYLSSSATLLPGTLILTGTPEGVGFVRNPPVYLAPGDFLETRIQGIGCLENPVAEERIP